MGRHIHRANTPPAAQLSSTARIPFVRALLDSAACATEHSTRAHPTLVTIATRSLFAAALAVTSIAFAVEPTGGAETHGALTRINPEFMVTAKEAGDWHRFKDQHGPALSGNPSWQKFMGFVEDKLREYGAVHVVHKAMHRALGMDQNIYFFRRKTKEI